MEFTNKRTRRSSNSRIRKGQSRVHLQWTIGVVFSILHIFFGFSHCHWINLHVWYQDPINLQIPQADSPSPNLSTITNNNNNNNDSNRLHGMQQDSSAAYYVHATDASSPNAENQGLGETEKQLPPCHQLDGLTQAQIDICLVFRDHMKAIVSGAKLGLSECRWQFRYNHWNCSSPPNVEDYFTNVETDIIVVESKNKSSNSDRIITTSTNSNSINNNNKNTGNSKSTNKNKTKKGTKNNNNNKQRRNAGTTTSVNLELQEKLNKQFNSVWNSILKQGSKEVAFAHAIWSAAVTQSIARACRDGSLSSCSCGRTPRPMDLNSEWKWGGCGDNLQYGYKFGADFVDSREKGSVDSKIRAKSLVNLHNNEAGRRAVLRKTKIVCKCHGVSGSCALVTCWHQIPSFREIGDYLKESYKSATLVKMNKRGRLQVKRAGVKVPSVHDLLYVENSPNYCETNNTMGIFGISGRICNRTSTGPDGCKQLCCSNGFHTSIIKKSTRCNCKFVWCCSVICQQCKQVHKVSSCN